VRHRRYCLGCARTAVREAFDVGRKAAHRPEFLAKRAETQRRHKQAIRAWKASDLPEWLTREVYVKQVQPKLASVTKANIQQTLRVSEPYATFIQAGTRIPHPRHWQALANLVGVSSDA